MRKNRRLFIKDAATAVAAAGMLSPWRNVLGANEKIRVGVVGFRGRGNNHIGGFDGLPNVEIAGLCDCDREVLEGQVRRYHDKGRKVAGHTDYRKLLEDKSIDVISIATPNHTHALISIEAIQAGKDVYVEKPVSHNVWEGRQIVNAARKYKKIVQTGTQSRSNPGMREAVQYIHDGSLGKIKVVRGFCYKRRKSIGKVSAAQTLPASIDYDLWTGPAPMKPLMRARLHYDWHWVWDTGNGDLGNQGIHQMDIARWVLGAKELSPRVVSIGGRLGYDDDGESANTQVIFHDFVQAPLFFEVRGLGLYAGSDNRAKYRGVSVGVVVDCEDGYMVMPTYDSGIVFDHGGKEVKRFRGGGNHFANFIKAVRSRKQTDLHADILEGHLSSALCHTGNISHLLGKFTSQGAIMENIQGSSLLADCMGRMSEHLVVNDVDLSKTPLTLGKALTMNPKSEQFIDDSLANKMLSRNYRRPFVVPEIV